MNRIPRLVRLIPLVTCGLAGPAFADGGNLLEQNFALSLGVFDMSSDTTIRADGLDSDSVGDRIDLERNLNILDEDVFRAEAMWRFLERHKLLLMYFDTNRTGRRVIDREIHFGDETFPIDAEVESRLGFDILELAYEYQFLRRENYQLGASIGIHNVGIDLALDSDVSLGGGDPQTSHIRESVSTNAPLPVLGLRGTWHLGRDFYLQGHAQYFQLKIGDYDGSIQDYQLGVLWQFAEHFGVGLAYNVFDTRVDSEDEGGFEGRLDWEYKGGQLYVRAAW
jgi:hypothetical protein